MLHVWDMLLIALKSEFGKIPYIVYQSMNWSLRDSASFSVKNAIAVLKKIIEKICLIISLFKLENFSNIKSMKSVWFGGLQMTPIVTGLG